MNIVKGKLKVINANVVNVLQSCLSKLCPACQHAIGGELAFVAKSVLIELRFWHQALSIFSIQLRVYRIGGKVVAFVAKTSNENVS